MSKRRRGERQDRPAERTGHGATVRPVAAQAPTLASPQPSVAPEAGEWASRIPWLAAGGVALLAFLVYVRTLAPTVATGDSGELTTVALSLGLAHPPGYPTFTLLGHLFSLLPFGNPAWRVNLMSAAVDAVAILALAMLIGRTIRSSAAGASQIVVWVAAGVGAMSLALSTGFWRYSLLAEVFALSNLLGVLPLLLMLEWSRRPERTRLLWLAGLAGGLALTNQQTLLFTVPALLVLLGLGLDRFTEPPAGRRKGRPMPWAAIGIALLAGLLGLLPYLYLPLAAIGGAATVWGDPRTLDGLLAILTRSAYGTFSLTVRDTSGSGLDQIGLFLGYLWSAFTPVGILLAAVGGAWLAIRRTGEALALAAWVLLAGPVFLLLANPPLTDPVTRGVLERFYILPSIPIAIAVGVGAWRVIEELAGRVAGAFARRATIGTLAGLVMLMAALGIVRAPAVDASEDRVAESFAADILAPLPPNALLLMRGDEYYMSIVYAQEIKGVRPDVIALDTELLKVKSYVDLARTRHPDLVIPFAVYDGGRAASIGDLIDRALANRPVYTAGTMEEDLGLRFDLLDEGLTQKVVTNGEAPDPRAGLRADPGQADRLHPPTRSYPDTSWEGAIAAHYANLAFQTAVALQTLGPQPNAAEVERLYREAIRLDPGLSNAYKNLGLLINTNAGPSSDIISLWERFLELEPNDPEAGAIRSEIARLRSGGSPGASPVESPAP